MGPQGVPSRRQNLGKGWGSQEVKLGEEQSLKEVARAPHGAKFGDRGRDSQGASGGENLGKGWASDRGWEIGFREEVSLQGWALVKVLESRAELCLETGPE